MLTRIVRIQLALFTVLTLIALVTLGWYYLRVPALLGFGQYTLYAQLPASGGLYSTANVTYRGINIGKVTDVEPDEAGVRTTIRIDDRYRIPIDASANVHSVSAIGEQYLDLVSTGNPGRYLADGQTITKATVPAEIGPMLDATDAALSKVAPDKIASLLDESSHAFGGLGPALQRLVNSTQAIATDFNDNLGAVNDIIANSAPILDSQVNSADAIDRWTANMNKLAAQSADQDAGLRRVLSQAAPTANAATTLFGDIREALPQALGNIEIVLDMLKRYHAGVEQALVILPQSAAIGQTSTSIVPGYGLQDFALTLNQPPACMTGFLPASQWRSPADTSPAPLPKGLYCKIPKDFQGNAVRGARNIPCVDVPGKRAATPAECRSTEPYVPVGTNPWYGDPNQVLSCPAPAARCDQGVSPGRVIPAPSINNGMNPAPADALPPQPAPTSDPLTAPGIGSVTCNGQQPNPCVYTPPEGQAMYTPQSGEVVAGDGTRFNVRSSSDIGDEGWKQMLAPSDAPASP
jgi:phospholipid/cholesterol/gamma-HCH transport system substrate-binding protein